MNDQNSWLPDHLNFLPFADRPVYWIEFAAQMRHLHNLARANSISSDERTKILGIAGSYFDFIVDEHTVVCPYCTRILRIDEDTWFLTSMQKEWRAICECDCSEAAERRRSEKRCEKIQRGVMARWRRWRG